MRPTFQEGRAFGRGPFYWRVKKFLGLVSPWTVKSKSLCLRRVRRFLSIPRSVPKSFFRRGPRRLEIVTIGTKSIQRGASTTFRSDEQASVSARVRFPTLEVGITFFYLSQVCYTVLMNHLFNQFDVCIRCGCGLNDAIHGQDCLTDTERETLEARLTPLLDVPDEEGETLC